MPSEAERRALAELIEQGCINWADKFFDHDECVKLLAALSSPPTEAGAPPDTRSIQDVLRLHVNSAQAMYETYERQGDADGCRFESGILEGLKRAIEVADNRDKRAATPDAELRELRARREEAERIFTNWNVYDRDFGHWLEEHISKIAAREKELEGRK